MKEKLIEELKKERERFLNRNQDTIEHDLTIKYLQTGILPRNWEDYELLGAAKDDFNTLCSDYGVK
jgi:hypothetical protein